MDLRDRLAGAVWGHLIGDALGVPYEFKDASQITAVEWRGHGTHDQPAGTWSDDGALMLALLDSLLRKRAPGEARFDTTDQAKRFLAWRDDRDYTPDHNGMFDIGNATSSAIGRFRNGTPAEKSGGTGERDQGNGSLMRILPIALVERDLPDSELVAQAHRSSRVTHGHPIPQAMCALYVLLARNLLHGQARAEALDNARTALRHVYEQNATAEMWLGALQTIEGWSDRSGRGYVVDSFWSAWDSVAGAKGYRDAVVRAVRYGSDTDTTACIAGGLAGLRWGVEGIPSDWRTTLRGQDIVKPLVAALIGDPAAAVAPAARLAEVAPPGSRTSTTHPIRVDWVDQAAVPAAATWTGHLGMTILPGKKDDGIAGPHWRDLETDVARLADDWHTDTFVLLVQDRDLEATKVPKRAVVESMAAHGIDLIRYPIVDGGVPSDMASFAELLARIEGRLRSGQRVVVACRGGLGRTGTVVGCLLRDAGLGGPAAVARTRDSRHDTIENDRQEQFVLGWSPSVAHVRHGGVETPFGRYEGGGRERLGKPRQGDLTARHGYGPPVFKQCGYSCVYCGLDMAASFEAWLQLSVDHVIPRHMSGLGYPAELVEDIANLVTCCRACNDFGNRYVVAGPPPNTDDQFFDIRDRVFLERRVTVLAKRERERAIYAEIPIVGPDRPPTAGEDA